MTKVTNLIGKKFNYLTVVARAQQRGRKGDTSADWFCMCDCGNPKIVSARDLRKGHIKTCGQGKCPMKLALQRIGKAENRRPARFLISPERVKELSEGPCYFCGTTPALGIEEKVGIAKYTETNTVSCCPTCSKMKGKLGGRKFIDHALRIVGQQFGYSEEELYSRLESKRPS